MNPLPFTDMGANVTMIVALWLFVIACTVVDLRRKKVARDRGEQS